MANAQPLRALFLAFDKLIRPAVDLSAPTPLKIAFLNAQMAPGSQNLFGSEYHTVTCEQPLRSFYLDLKQAGIPVQPNLEQPSSTFDICLVLTGKFKAFNEAMIAKAARLTSEGGMVMVAGANNTGIASLRKNIAGIVDVEDSFSKYHSIVFWFRKSSKIKFPDNKNKHHIIEAGRQNYSSAPGLFSANKVDPGSIMLAECFDEAISGRVADLGAGWGYLSCELLRSSKNVYAIDLYEADWHAVEACKINLAQFSPGTEVGIFWHDVIREPIKQKHDWVITNPPFHQGKNSDVTLGQGFIEHAASILKKDGKLLMVANQHLAYERIIRACFNNFRVLKQVNGFKTIKAEAPKNPSG
ncbi:MAG: class I SAM-dependent methyltransferase [Rhizobiaceae bacterium]|nr:class I SAM-dependent methyltransferase [Rhizobiaceae bacterium]